MQNGIPTFQEFRILAALFDKRTSYVDQIAERSGITRESCYVILSKMEKHGTIIVERWLEDYGSHERVRLHITRSHLGSEIWKHGSKMLEASGIELG